MFSVNDLAPGMLVTLHGGLTGVITPVNNGNTLGIVGINSRGDFELFTTHLRLMPTTGLDSKFSIVDVYDSTVKSNFDYFDPCCRNKLWSYKDTISKEMTVSEIEAILGYPIKIVKED